MKRIYNWIKKQLEHIANKLGFKLRTKLIIIFLVVKVIPLILLTVIAWYQIFNIGNILREIAVEDSSVALNDIAIDNIERITTDTAKMIAKFLYERDDDILYISKLEPSEENFRVFLNSKKGRIIPLGEWELAPDGESWIPLEITIPSSDKSDSSEKSISTNSENDKDGFSYREPEILHNVEIPLYDEITFIDLNGNEVIKLVSADSPKKNYPLSTELKNVSIRENTYVKAETYFEHLKNLKPGEIYVSDVIGAYVGSNYIGMYTPKNVQTASETRGYKIEYDPKAQSYAGKENPNGQKFEGIVRWATPVTNDNGEIIGYVTLALNHDHIMEFVDHITPMIERYTDLPSAYEGNYAFIWDYKCRNISHPRHNSIVGYDPETGDPQVPWLESSIYEAWQESGIEKWTDFIADWPVFDNQSRSKTPAAALTKAGLVGLDGRYLNNAPQCTGWMDLTQYGGSGSFYILWSGLNKLTTAGAIPYYTGQYAPSAENDYSKRGFGFVTIGAGLDDFTRPAIQTEEKLKTVISENLTATTIQLVISTLILVTVVVMVAISLASSITGKINVLIRGISRFTGGERQFRFNTTSKDEFGTLSDSFDNLADGIVDSVKSPLTITNLDLEIIYMNEAGLNITNNILDNIIGKSYKENSIYPNKSVYCPITALQEGRESEVYYQEETGHYFKGTANYLLDHGGKKIGYIITSSDVTEIQNARKRAESASKSKTDFLSNMSHEMRTPMNAIIGMTIIGMSSDEIKKKDYAFGKIHDASGHLLAVINDILDMSKIEANKLDLSPVEFNFEKAVQKTVNIITFRTDEKHQSLSVNIDENIPRTIIGDDHRFIQVLTNILSNAVKFTPEYGSISVTATFVQEINGICTIMVEVQDTGIGISEEQLSRLFRPFEQADNNTSRKYGGTGLGLTISKSIVEMMGGHIWVETEIGKGSKFIFTIQAVRGAVKYESLLHSEINWNNIRILAVDDSKEVLEYFGHIVGRLGLKCDTALSGEEALEKIRQNSEYDIYFVDWKMPGMDGLELSRRIKDSMWQKSIVIMISAAEYSEIEEKAKKSGVDKFLAKPLFESDIADCINECIGVLNQLYEDSSNKDMAADSDLSDENCFQDNCILLAEDIEINREIVMMLLEPTNIKIDCACNGIEAVEMFTSNPQKYDMILMDIQMPEMDGLQATQNIRASKIDRADTIPIVAMTANVFREDVDKCINAGMNDHIGKPINFDEIMAILKKYLKQ